MGNSVSVVTTVRNSEKTIEKAIKSVLNLNYDEIEYIIVDGKSDDRTYKIVQSYESEFREKNIRYLHFSEYDSGVYEAMNKGIMMCKNEWIIFLGADDYFYNADVLKMMFANTIPDDISAVYGDVFLKNDDKLYYRAADIPNILEYKMPCSHQALFVRNDILKKNSFDEKYKVLGDMELCMRLYRNRVKFLYFPVAISVFSVGGISTSKERKKQIIHEYKNIIRGNTYGIISDFRQYIYLHFILPMKVNKMIYTIRLICLTLGEKH